MWCMEHAGCAFQRTGHLLHSKSVGTCYRSVESSNKGMTSYLPYPSVSICQPPQLLVPTAVHFSLYLPLCLSVSTSQHLSLQAVRGPSTCALSHRSQLSATIAPRSSATFVSTWTTIWSLAFNGLYDLIATTEGLSENGARSGALAALGPSKCVHSST